MAPITDLSWTQLNNALNARLGLAPNNAIVMDAYGVPASIDLGAILKDIPIDSNTNAYTGVIKFICILLDACRDAQVAINPSVPAGERLLAFPAATTAAPVGTLVPITRTVNSRADLTSVTRVVGTNS